MTDVSATLVGAPQGSARRFVRALRWSVQRVALHVYQRLPVQARRAVVRTVSPTYTAGSIVVIGRRADGALLLIRQTYRRGWGLPGGLLAKGETPAEAAVREVREEVGIALDADALGPAKLVVDLVPRRMDFVFRATLDLPDGDTVVPTSPELEEAGWHRRDALPRLQDETRTALAALERNDVMPFISGRHDRQPPPRAPGSSE